MAVGSMDRSTEVKLDETAHMFSGHYHLTHKAREEGPSWISFPAESKIEAVRSYFDDGVSHDEDKKNRHRVGAGWILQITELIDSQTDLTW